MSTARNKSPEVVTLIASDPQLAAMLSKTVLPVNPIDRQNDKQKHQNLLNSGQITQLSQAISIKSENNRNILQLFPDLELAAQIVVSSVLSPKDMIFQELLYRNKDNTFPAELAAKLISKGKETFEGVYKFDQEVADVLRSVLFQNGAEIRVVIPENILDDIINEKISIATESASRTFTSQALMDVFGEDGPSHPDYLGYISDEDASSKKRCSLESMLENKSHGEAFAMKSKSGLMVDGSEFTNKIDFSDNFNLLKIPSLIDHSRKKIIKSTLEKSGMALESAHIKKKNGFSSSELKAAIYKDPNRKHEEVLIIPDEMNASRRSVGRPLCMKIPVEAAVPVYTPGNEKNHIGYFILIDIDGNPVSKLSKYNKSANMRSLFEGKGTDKDPITTSLLDRVNKNMVGDTNAMTIDDIDLVFKNIVEKNMLQKLRNGIYKGELEFSMNQDITATMLSRTLAGKYTRLLFLPKEMVSYFAIRYNENGTGRSYLDDISFLTSVRAVLLMAKVVGMTKNAIPITHVNMILDPKDHDPENTIATAMHEIIKTRTGNFPIGSNSPLEILDYINRAGLEFTFEGHPGLPATKLEFENKRMDHALPDSDLDEALRKQTYMAFSLPPELVDNGYSAEFAASVTANNVMMAKNTSVLQSAFSNCISSHYQRILGFDQTFQEECIEIINENIALVEKNMPDDDKDRYTANKDRYLREYLKKFLSTVAVEFPKSDESSLTVLGEKFDEYSDAVDKCLEQIVSSSAIPQEMAGEISGNIEVVKGLWKAHLLRSWIANNNYVPEVMELTSIGEDGDAKSSLNDITVMHIKAVAKSVIDLLRTMDSAKKASDLDFKNIGQEPSSTEPSADTPSEEGGSEGGDIGEDEAEGGAGEEDFGLGDMGT